MILSAVAHIILDSGYKVKRAGTGRLAMPRVMVFIDGTWLYKNLPKLRREFQEEEYGIDYGKLPQEIAKKISEAMGIALTDVDVVRSCLFGSYADPNTLVDAQDKAAAYRQLDFFEFLKEEFHYEVEPYPIDFQGHRLFSKDRDAEYLELNAYVKKIKEDPVFRSEEVKRFQKEVDAEKDKDPKLKRALENPRLHVNTKKRLLQRTWGFLKASKYFALQDAEVEGKWEPKEKCVDIALSTSMLYYAAIPYAYDIAVAIIGDSDYKPVLQHVRRLGKRVMIVSIHGSCPQEFFAPADPERLRDFDTLFINDLLGDIRLELKKEKRQCSSCRKEIWEAYFLRKGRKYYCPECRERHQLEARGTYPGEIVAPVTEQTEETEEREDET